MNDHTFLVNEVFYSTQGEGVRAGTLNVFVRLSKCNLACSKDGEAGFDCDTEFESSKRMTLEDLELLILRSQCPDHDDTAGLGELRPLAKCHWIVLTGGEPALQLQGEQGKAFCDYFHERGYKIAIETNGTLELPKVAQGYAEMGMDMKDSRTRARLNDYLIDWICVSPKSAEHTLKQLWAHELKYVRNTGQFIPKPLVKALHYLLSPAFPSSDVTTNGYQFPDKKSVARCVELCKENPEWRVSLQLHKFLGVR